VADLHENLITPEQAITLDGLFVQRVRRSSGRPAYQHYERRSKEWRSYSWGEMGDWVARWRHALAGEGLKPGDRVAVLLRNCPEWVMFDQAALGLGLVTVPLYTDDRPDNAAYILQDAGVRLILIQDLGRWEKLAAALPRERPLTVLLLEGGEEARAAAAGDQRLRYVNDWLPQQAPPLQQRRDADPHALASIVYTSGTTGRPKGVMLTHHNMLSVAHGTLMSVQVYEEDLLLSFLPLSHTFERTVGYYLVVMAGATVAYSRSVAQLAEDLTVVRPTALIAVPRIFEKVHGRIQEKLAGESAIARRIFLATVAIGWTRFEHEQGRAPWRPWLLLWPLLEKLVAAKVQARLGGRLRLAVSGGAPIAPEIARFFIGLGVPLLQGYGLTETGPVVAANRLEDNVPASVGLVLRNLEVRVGAQDELLVRGPGVMKGYWNNHSATAQMIDADGWLHTGDQARIDEGGHIYITGRIKDILVLSNGEKVPPADMEGAIALDPLFEQVMVIGEGEPYLTALLVLNADKWSGFAQAQGVDPLNAGSLRDSRVEQAVLRRIRDQLKDFPGYAKIRRVTLKLEPWTVEDGLLTPTMKVKRAKVLERYHSDVEGMYSGG
jgi:long-chain acyl-CoA synthetase